MGDEVAESWMEPEDEEGDAVGDPDRYVRSRDRRRRSMEEGIQ